MTRLLVSVRTATEAEHARYGGADIIDVKEPRRGSLGQPDDETVRAVVGAVPAVTASVALGELAEWIEGRSSKLPPLGGVDFVKCGLAHCAQRTDWTRHWLALAARVNDVSAGCTQLIAVAYADFGRASAPDPLDVMAVAIAAPCGGILIDTWQKDGRGLLSWMHVDELAAITQRCREAGRPVALAGSLRPPDLERLHAAGPDIIAVRGAACRNGARDQEIDPLAIAHLARIVRQGRCVPQSSST